MSSAQPPFVGALERLFQDGVPIVFWNDPDAEFSSQVDAILLDGVSVIRLDRTPALQVKMVLERQKGARWLIYAPSDEPGARERLAARCSTARPAIQCRHCIDAA
jgi:hypothetical protein